MNVKMFEVRDEATHIPCIGIEMKPSHLREMVLLRRAGYGEPRCILFGRADKGQFSHDPYDHKGRTMPNAHAYVEAHWDELQTGDVIDVQFILGETTTKKEPE